MRLIIVISCFLGLHGIANAQETTITPSVLGADSRSANEDFCVLCNCCLAPDDNQQSDEIYKRIHRPQIEATDPSISNDFGHKKASGILKRIDGFGEDSFDICNYIICARNQPKTLTLKDAEIPVDLGDKYLFKFRSLE